MANLIESLLNVGVEVLKEREEQKEEAKEEKKTKLKKTKKTKETVTNSEDKAFEEFHGLTYEEVCEKDLKEAKEQGKEDPDFDFRNLYEKGDEVYYVMVTDNFIKRKEMVRLKLRTVYPRMMVGVEESFGCHCIGFKQKDMVFINVVDANTYYDSLNEYTEEEKLQKDTTED